jgi:excisionase family DNA binding protein
MENEVLTRSELAKLLRVNERTIDNLRKEGLPYFKVGTNVRFHWSKVLEWLDQRSQRKSSEVVA